MEKVAEMKSDFKNKSEEHQSVPRFYFQQRMRESLEEKRSCIRASIIENSRALLTRINSEAEVCSGDEQDDEEEVGVATIEGKHHILILK